MMSFSQTDNNETKNQREIYPDVQGDLKNPEDKKVRNPRSLTRKKNFRPIILCFAVILFSWSLGYAQLEGEITVGASYSDNQFQLSEYDLSRWENNSSGLSWAESTDDLNLSTRIDLAYPISYRWWTFTPSITGKLNQNISNGQKHRSDTILRFRADRYYWSISALYGYYPYIYYRHYNDSDGSGDPKKYTYERNLYRADVIVRPIRNLSAFANVRYEDLYYNQYFTEADGDRLTTEFGLRYRFPIFTLQGSYAYRTYDNTGYKAIAEDDGSYDSNIYRGVLRLRKMPLQGDSTKDMNWHPYLELSKEDRFYQGDSPWYAGREYAIYNTTAGLNFMLHPSWNLSLDYSHIFRNVDSPNESVLRLKEFSENRLSAALSYKF
jgi:hypothetical protein